MLILELTVPSESTETLGDSPPPPRQREQLGEPGPLGKGSSRCLRDLRSGWNCEDQVCQGQLHLVKQARH